MGQSPDGDSYNTTGQGVPLLNGPTEFGPRHPVPIQWTNSPTRFAEPGDVLLCVRGATTGRKNIANERVCIGRGLAAIRGIRERTSTEYLWFVFDFVTDALLKETAGSTFPNLPCDKLSAVCIPLPSLAEQERIAARLREQLAEVERARAAVAAQLEAAEALPAAFLRAVFGGRAPASGAGTAAPSPLPPLATSRRHPGRTSDWLSAANFSHRSLSL